VNYLQPPDQQEIENKIIKETIHEFNQRKAHRQVPKVNKKENIMKENTLGTWQDLYFIFYY